MSHSLLWRRIVLVTAGAYSSIHGMFHTIGTCMARRLQKVYVHPSVCPFVMLIKMHTLPILTVEQ